MNLYNTPLKLSVGALVIALCSVATTQLAAAASINAEACNGGQCVSQNSSTGFVSATDSFSVDGGDTFSTSSANITVGYGFMAGLAISETTRRQEGANDSALDARFFGNWDDVVTMNPTDSSLLGTTGTAVAEVEISALWNGDGFANYEETFYFGTMSVAGENEAFENPFFSGTSRLVSVDYSFIWGTPFDLMFQIEGVAQVDPLGVGPGDTITRFMDATNTVQWQGLNDVRDNQGNLADFSVSSVSGTDWEVAIVPIPAAFWLFGSALGLLGWMRRKAS